MAKMIYVSQVVHGTESNGYNSDGNCEILINADLIKIVEDTGFDTREKTRIKFINDSSDIYVIDSLEEIKSKSNG